MNRHAQNWSDLQKTAMPVPPFIDSASIKLVLFLSGFLLAMLFVYLVLSVDCTTGGKCMFASSEDGATFLNLLRSLVAN